MLLDIGFAERADGRLQLQLREQGIEARAGEVAPGDVDLVLRVEDVDVDPHADLVTEPVRFERAETRHQRRFERPDLGQAIDHAEVGLTRAVSAELRFSLSSVANSASRLGAGFADPRIDRTPLKDRDVHLQTDLAASSCRFHRRPDWPGPLFWP
jgi:hypothetical protein